MKEEQKIIKLRDKIKEHKTNINNTIKTNWRNFDRITEKDWDKWSKYKHELYVKYFKEKESD